MKKFILSSHHLKQGLHKAGTVIMPKSVLPALSNIYCKVGDKQIEMIASDTETTIIYKTEAETFGEAFEFLLPYALISKIVSLSKDVPLTFEMIKNKLKITGDNDVYELKSLEKVENFPKLPEVPKENSIDLDKNIIQWLRLAAQTVSKDEARPQVTKVLLELRNDKSTIVSTDASYMVFSYYLPLKSSVDDDLLLSAKVIKAIEDMDSAKLFWHDTTIVFEGDNLTVLVTRSQAKFPNFRAIFPEDFNSNVTLNRSELIAALEKCNINTGALKEMNIHLDAKDKVVFVANDADYGININVEVAGTYTGHAKSIKASSEKMLKLMNQVDFEMVDLAIHEQAKPILFRSTDEGYTGLLMTTI